MARVGIARHFDERRRRCELFPVVALRQHPDALRPRREGAQRRLVGELDGIAARVEEEGGVEPRIDAVDVARLHPLDELTRQRARRLDDVEARQQHERQHELEGGHAGGDAADRATDAPMPRRPPREEGAQQ